MPDTRTVALVTGANRGIGRALADEVAKRPGTRVLAGARTPEKVEDPGQLVPVRPAHWLGGPVIHTPGVKIPVGGSKTIDVTLFSDAPTTGPWRVIAYDGNYLAGGSAELSL